MRSEFVNEWLPKLFEANLLGLGLLAFVAVKFTRRIVAEDSTALFLGFVTGAVTFVGYSLAGLTEMLNTGDDGLIIVVRAAALGGIATSAVWLVSLPIRAGERVWYAAVGAVRRTIEVVKHPGRERKRLEQARLEAERNERDRKAAAEAAAKRAEIHREIRRRCTAARQSCDAYYLEHARELGSRFPAKEFKAFLRRHFPDEITVADAEHRASQLLESMKAIVRAVRNTKYVDPVTALVTEYDRRRKEIERQAIDPEVRDTILYQLKISLLAKLQEKVTL